MEPRRARDGVRWLRWVTDVPNTLKDIARGDVRLAEYLRTLREVEVEAVWSVRDPLPALLEVGLAPYLAAPRGL